VSPADPIATILYVGDESECLADFRAETRTWAGTAGGDGEPGVCIETAADGVEAMAWLKENGARGSLVVVLDFALPVLETYGLLKGVRAEDSLAGLPIVLISPRAADPRVAKLGVAALVQRPVEMRQLTDAVRGLLPV
jgi:DNA-binding response OmpR family regulator